jgi:hypothetical protein
MIRPLFVSMGTMAFVEKKMTKRYDTPGLSTLDARRAYVLV